MDRESRSRLTMWDIWELAIDDSDEEWDRSDPFSRREIDHIRDLLPYHHIRLIDESEMSDHLIRQIDRSVLEENPSDTHSIVFLEKVTLLLISLEKYRFSYEMITILSRDLDSLDSRWISKKYIRQDHISDTMLRTDRSSEEWDRDTIREKILDDPLDRRLMDRGEAENPLVPTIDGRMRMIDMSLSRESELSDDSISDDGRVCEDDRDHRKKR